jgi:pyruvoyl-dependent arginine decarboxylase (PvlArgDC)
MSLPPTTLSTFVTDLSLNLVSNISGPRMIIPDNNNLGFRIVSNDGTSSGSEYLTVDTLVENINLQKMTSITGLNINNALNVSGVSNFINPVSINNILEVDSLVNSNEFGNGAITTSGGVYIAKDLWVKENAYKTEDQFWTVPSDKRIKVDIEDVNTEDCLNSIKTIQIKNYKFSEQYLSKYNLKENQQIGVIADELEVTHPKLVRKLEKGPLDIPDFKTVNMSETQYEIIACVQHLLKSNEDLQKQVKELQHRIDELSK